MITIKNGLIKSAENGKIIFELNGKEHWYKSPVPVDDWTGKYLQVFVDDYNISVRITDDKEA